MGQRLVERIRRVKLVVMDVDGVMTDGGMYYGQSGEELKKFNTRDGQGIARLHEAGLRTAILTRENSQIVVRRGAKLNISETHIGVLDKLTALRAILARQELTLEETAYVGDDVHDVEVMRHVGLAVAVADATRRAREAAHIVTHARGGEGAVRELCELILDYQQENVHD
ncbi:MAG: HAD hydrolase family protein [Chloroflexi bacterium]|nr:HAD hydrolase family protein [Chloroflexota bacterium]